MLLLLAVAALLPSRARADGDVLWRLVHTLCVPDQRQHGRPQPCVQVDLQGDGSGDAADRGWAVLKDIRGRSQYLLIPTARIPGIESPALLRDDAPNYFAAAWAQRDRVGAALGRTLDRQAIGLAINSRLARSQQQLHIHIDCLRADIRDTLARYAAGIGPRWTPFPVPLAGARYWAMRIPGAELTVDPFRLAAARLRDPLAAMGRQTLVLAGASFPDGPGFLLLDGEVRLLHGELGGGEDLQDHGCALAQ